MMAAGVFIDRQVCRPPWLAILVALVTIYLIFPLVTSHEKDYLHLELTSHEKGYLHLELVEKLEARQPVRFAHRFGSVQLGLISQTNRAKSQWPTHQYSML